MPWRLLHACERALKKVGFQLTACPERVEEMKEMYCIVGTIGSSGIDCEEGRKNCHSEGGKRIVQLSLLDVSSLKTRLYNLIWFLFPIVCVSLFPLEGK